MFLWRQEDTSSLRLFSVDSSGRQMIRNFSLRQRLHLLLELLYGECDERMRQEIKCSMLLSLRVQICLLSSVEFLCLAWRNDAVWLGALSSQTTNQELSNVHAQDAKLVLLFLTWLRSQDLIDLLKSVTISHASPQTSSTA